MALLHSGLDFGLFCHSLQSWAGISSTPSCSLRQASGNPQMPSHLCYVLHIPPALGGKKITIFPSLYSSFPLEALPRMPCAVPVLGEGTAWGGDPALTVRIFRAILQRPRAWGTRWELLTPNSPRSLEPLLGSLSSMGNFETFLKGISYKQMGIWKFLAKNYK